MKCQKQLTSSNELTGEVQQFYCIHSSEIGKILFGGQLQITNYKIVFQFSLFLII